MCQELYNLRQEYDQKLQEQQQQQEHKDLKKLRQEYLSSVQKVQEESERKIQSANNRVNEMEKTLVRAEKKLSWLQNNFQELEYTQMIVKEQDRAISILEERLKNAGGGDENEREIERILASVVDASDVIETIERENPNEKDRNEIQANHFRTKGPKIQANQ